MSGSASDRTAVLTHPWNFETVCAAGVDSTMEASLGDAEEAGLWFGVGEHSYCDACGVGCPGDAGELVHPELVAEWTATSGAVSLVWEGATRSGTVVFKGVVFEGESCEEAPAIGWGESWPISWPCD